MPKEENLYTHQCIRTHSGEYVNVFNPMPETIKIEDIAHALSRQPRFGGHLPVEYSVARHCIACCDEAPDGFRLCALLHDAAEAYLIDLPRPIKKEIEVYKAIEDGLMKVIARKFGIEYPFPSEVHAVDNIMLQIEWDNVFLKKHSILSRIFFWIDHQFQKRLFLKKYNQYRRF